MSAGITVLTAFAKQSATCGAAWFLIISVLLPAVHAASGEEILEQGADLQRQGKHQAALELFARSAQQGNPAAAYGLGVLYFDGNGVPKDLKQSSEWFKVAAEKGYVPAQYNLGNAYLRGRGVNRDLDRAEYWWRKAAQQGNLQAQFNLGALLHGWGNTPAMQEEGIAWLRVSAASGFEKSLENMKTIGEPVEYAEIKPAGNREPLRSEARLLTMNPRRFTLQVLSGRSADSAQRFIEDQHLQGLALPFRFLRENEQWRGVVYGEYQSRAEAQSSIGTLTPTLKNASPWVRTVAGVQSDIREVWRQQETPGRSPNLE